MDYMPPMPRIPVIPTLPQQQSAEDQKRRQSVLAQTQNQYILSKTKSDKNPLGIPLLIKMPIEQEQFNDQYHLGRGVATVPLFTNVAAASSQIAATEAFAPVAGISTYESYYPSYPKPDAINEWLTDQSFAEQRLSGVNPVALQRVEQLPDNFNIEALKKVLVDKDKLDKLLEKKNLYMVDYTKLLSEVKGGQVNVYGMPEPIQKYLPKPIALFEWINDPWDNGNPTDKNGRLMPVAIQIDLSDGKGVRVLTPQCPPLLWGIAKLCFSTADANAHEMDTHLGIAHFAQESFGAVTPRQLAPQHPVHILLRPHLRFMVFNNAAGLTDLIQENGPVDFLLAGSLEESVGIALKASQAWSIKNTLPNDLKNRGVACEHHLPHYPYRDDGLLIWNALTKYVKEYLGLYYKSGCDLSEDYELQNWAAELASNSESGGNIKDMPSRIENIDDLTEILTQIIFTASAFHSAVNFTQYPYLGFSPNASLAGYADYQAFFSQPNPTDQEQLAFILKYLPPPVMAIGQIKITGALSAYHYDQLGDYKGEFDDGLAKHALYRFTQNLHAIEEQINARNRVRIVDYPYLKPSEILNSASI